MAVIEPPVPLEVIAGLPYRRRFRVIDGKLIWPELEDFEARGQARAKNSPTSPVVANLTPFLTATFDGDDILVDLLMTGNDTRNLSKGFYDIVLSDVGVEDEKAFPVSAGSLSVDWVLTSGVGDD